MGWACVAHLSFCFEETLYRTFYRYFLPNFQQFQRRRPFRNRPTRNKNCLWQLCLLTNHGEMSNLYRGSSIDASYQVSVHFPKQFQRRRFFRNQPIRNKNCLWWPYFFTDQDKMSILEWTASIDASYQVSVHLAKQF